MTATRMGLSSRLRDIPWFLRPLASADIAATGSAERAERGIRAHLSVWAWYGLLLVVAVRLTDDSVPQTLARIAVFLPLALQLPLDWFMEETRIDHVLVSVLVLIGSAVLGPPYAGDELLMQGALALAIGLYMMQCVPARLRGMVLRAAAPALIAGVALTTGIHLV